MSANSNGSNKERYAMNKNKLTGNLPGQKQQSPQSPAPPCSPLAITSTKDSGAKNDLPQDCRREVFDLFFKLAKQKEPSTEDVAQLHRQTVSTPDAWSLASIPVELMRKSLIEKLAGQGAVSALYLAETDILAKQLGYDTAPALERMLIDHLLNVRLRLLCAETGYNQNVAGSVPIITAEYWNGLLSSTQARFLRAVETLARVRRLARNTPALQINIAHEDSQQANVRNGVNGHRLTPSIEENRLVASN
jgi:hypothetical protein